MTDRPIRLAHLSIDDDLARRAGMTGYLVSLLSGMSRHRFRHSLHTLKPVLPVHQAAFRDEFDCEVHHSLPDWAGLAASLVGSDIALVYHGLSAHLSFSAARAAGVPVIVEWLACPCPGQQYEYIDWSICSGGNVLALQPDRSRAAVSYNGIDIRRFACNRPLPRGEKLVLIQVGMPYDIDVNSMKEILVSLRSRGVPAVGWVVGMEGPSDEMIAFWGWRNDVETFLAQADVLLHFCPRDEAFGCQVAEAMAAGVLPVVARAWGPAEQVEHGVSGFVFTPRKPHEALQPILRIWTDLQRGGRWVNTLQQNARRRAERFSSETMCQEHEELFEHLLATAQIQHHRIPGIDARLNRFHAFMDSLLAGRPHEFWSGVAGAVADTAARGDASTWTDYFNRLLTRPTFSPDSYRIYRAFREWGSRFIPALENRDRERCRYLCAVLQFALGMESQAQASLDHLSTPGVDPSPESTEHLARTEAACWGSAAV